MTGYASPIDVGIAQPLRDPAEPEGFAETYYSVNMKSYRHGHACTGLVFMDMGQRRVISEKLSCYQVPAVTRRQALELILAAVMEALSDLAD